MSVEVGGSLIVHDALVELVALAVGRGMVDEDVVVANLLFVNKNLLLTDKAHVTTKPFLEIYADDVQCSHGATVGQLDDDAMFYLRTRGICERNARMLKNDPKLLEEEQKRLKELMEKNRKR